MARRFCGDVKVLFWTERPPPDRGGGQARRTAMSGSSVGSRGGYARAARRKKASKRPGIARALWNAASQRPFESWRNLSILARLPFPITGSFLAGFYVKDRHPASYPIEDRPRAKFQALIVCRIDSWARVRRGVTGDGAPSHAPVFLVRAHGPRICGGVVQGAWGVLVLEKERLLESLTI